MCVCGWVTRGGGQSDLRNTVHEPGIIIIIIIIIF